MSFVRIGYDEVRRALQATSLIEATEAAFAAYSRGMATCPPPGELLLDDPKGEVHIKYAALEGSPFFVVKIAGGFPGNNALGLSTSDGVLLLFSRKTGEPRYLLEDRGQITDWRTAAAGAVCAKHLASEQVDTVGVLGAGIQAELQVLALAGLRPFEELIIWARRPAAVAAYCRRMARAFPQVRVRASGSPAEVAAAAGLLICATASRTPLLQAADLREGQHITAVGADCVGKCELDSSLIQAADLVVVDSLSQASERGDLFNAIRSTGFDVGRALEIGQVIGASSPWERPAHAKTVALLTGLGVQDLAVANALLPAFGHGS